MLLSEEEALDTESRARTGISIVDVGVRVRREIGCEK